MAEDARGVVLVGAACVGMGMVWDEAHGSWLRMRGVWSWWVQRVWGWGRELVGGDRVWYGARNLVLVSAVQTGMVRRRHAVYGACCSRSGLL